MPKPPSINDLNVIKKPGTKQDFGAGGTVEGEKNLIELMQCMDDPMFFMESFMKIQHPTKGAIPFVPFKYQRRMIKGMHEHKNSILMTARQLGKSSTFNTSMNKDGNQVKIGKLFRFSLKEKTINFLENLLIFVSKR